jgi:2-polyprenyl-6-methoxyphenol hydroxylase-like FAD-dependent oxidoreductase
MVQEHVPVLIVGGGVVGLSASLFLLHQGVPSLLVERHASTSILPRARGLHFRTMEFYREIGLDETIRATGAAVIKQGSFGGFLIGETLLCARRQPIVVTTARGRGESLQDLSPEDFCFCPQDELEPVLLAAAYQRGGDLRFNTELISFEQDDDGVTATFVERTSGTRSTVRADYLIAADGARSPMRTLLGITQSGEGALEHYLNIYFEADLSEQVRGKEFSQCLIERPDIYGVLVSINNTNRWVFHLSYDPARGETPDDFPPERCQELIRQVVGLPGLAVEIRSISPWESAVRIADSFQRGRIFLAGDAAHLMPPWGGFGANTGIADAHNLAWKLAAIFNGQATAALLETYEMERRPVACFSAEQSALRSDIRIRYGLGSVEETEAVQQKLVGMGVVVGGYQYCSPTIFAEDEGASVYDHLGFDGRPGTRAPHVWVEYRGQLISTLDLLWRGFVLLTGPDGRAWYEAAQQLSSRLDIDLEAYRVGPSGDLLDPECYWHEAAGIQADGALLMRPDGIVAWRSWESVPEPERVLEQVMMRVLCRR